MPSGPLAIVTGAAHRLGSALTDLLASSGYSILLHYWKSEAAARQLASQLGTQGTDVTICQADLSRPSGIRDLFAQVDDLGSTLKVLVNSAAVLGAGRPATVTVDEWDTVLNLNLRAPFFCSREAAARMVDGGLIVNISDIGARKAWTRFAPYTVSKAAVESMTALLARAYAPSIRVNAIAPGLVLPSAEVDPKEWDRLVQRLPLKRPAQVNEIASALAFLLTNEYVTGQTIAVDGGYSLLG
jgi:pteridine reductase